MSEKSNYDYRGRLRIFEDERSVFVKGETFTYGFDKKSGLINSLEVLGDDFLRNIGSEVPDIYISDAIDPGEAFYAAKYENEAECDVISANPYEIHIRTHGIYHNSAGNTFPVRYRITYEIQSDGAIFVIVDNKAYDDCVIRWLCVSRGVLNPSFCKYFSYLADQSETDTTRDYTFKEIPSEMTEDLILFSGRLIPWFWFGNDRTGVEISVWDVAHHRYGGSVIAEEHKDSISGISLASGTLWEIFSIRDVHTPVSSGWEQTSYFAISVTPPKHYNPMFSGLRAYREDHKYLSNEEIEDLSRKGYNFIIGKKYIADNESEARRVISVCHEYGMKVIPCVSLMELSEDTEIFEEYAPQWQIEPVISHETSLMCPGAEGWREYWKQDINKIVEDYDFDGIYIDLRYDRLACRNPRHGCQKRYMHPTFIWVRDMLKYAWVKMKSKNPDSVVVANTDLLPISMICSWIDIRSVGKSQDIRQMDRMAGKAFYSPYRFGCGSLMNPEKVQKIDQQVVSLSLLYMTPLILGRDRSQEEIDLILPYWNALGSFGISNAKWYPGFLDDPAVATTSNPNLCVNVYRNDELLLILVNLSSNEVCAYVSLLNFAELGLQDGRKYMVYEPISKRMKRGDRRQWSCGDLRSFPITVSGYGSRLLCIREFGEEL